MRSLFIVAFALILFSCEKENSFSVKNPGNEDRTDEILILTKDELAQKVELKDGLLPVFEVEEDQTLPSQVDDLDGDGNWDEVVVLLNIKASESQRNRSGFC